MTPEEINALPDRVRQYIHDLETNADPAGTIQDNALLKDQTRELDAMIARLKKELATLMQACKTWMDSPNNRQARALVRDLCKVNHDGTERRTPKEDWDCGCSDGAEDVCVSITCPRK